MAWRARCYTDNIAEALAKRLAQALVDELQVILADPQHPLRQHYAAAVTQWLQRLQNDPDMQQKLQQIKDQLLNHPSLQESMRQFWQ